MSDPIDPKVLEALAASIADHSYEKHGHEFRNEKQDGSPRSSSPKKSYGEALPIHSREDLAEHIKTTLQSPDTKYFIDEAADGRMVFFNEKTGTTVIFNPHQLTGVNNADGHVGTVMREKVADYGTTFQKEIDLTTTRLNRAPEIRNAVDGKWSLPAEVFNTPTARSADFVADLPAKTPGHKLPDAILDANKLDVAESVREISRLAKAGRLSANITGVGVVIGVASLALMNKAHAAQRDFAGDLEASGVIDKEAYEAYLELNTDTENLLYGDLALSTADPTGLSIVVTAAAETTARSNFKEWADEHAPGLSEEHFQSLAMSMFPDNSARTEMLWEAKDQLPELTAGQPEFLHRTIDLNALYEEANDIHYNHKEGYVYSGNIAETTAKAQELGIDVPGSNDPYQAIQNLQGAIKLELMQELDQQYSSPENIDYMLNQVPVDDRLEYARRLAGSENDPEQFAQDHPEVSAYVKEYDDSLTGWGWTLDNDDPLKNDPSLLNDYIKSKTQATDVTPVQTAPAAPSVDESAAPVTPTENRTEPLQLGQTSTGDKPTPNDVIDRSADINQLLPPDINFTVQSSDNNASVTRGIVPDEQIRLVQAEDKDPATLPEIEQERQLQALRDQQRLQEQAAQLEQQQQQMNNPMANR